MDFNKIKNLISSKAEAIKSNKSVYYSLLSLIGLILLIILFAKYRSIVANEKLEPVLIKNIKKANIKAQVSDDLLPVPLSGVGFTYSTWLYCNSWGTDFAHVFSKGNENLSSMCPGVWMLPNINSIAVILDTGNRTKGDENIQEIKNKIPKNYMDTGIKGTKIPNQTPCTCKSFLAVDDFAEHAAFLNDTKECYIYSEKRELVDSKIGTTFSKKNINNQTTNPKINKDIIKSDNCVIVENVPMKRWFHLVIVTSQTAVEVYLDGKLYKTRVLKSYPKSNNQPLFINLQGGFDGMMNELRYYPYELKYLDVYSMYARGPTPFYFMDLLKGNQEHYITKFKEFSDKSKESLQKMADKIYGDETPKQPSS
jgi:hypothetical protein